MKLELTQREAYVINEALVFASCNFAVMTKWSQEVDKQDRASGRARGLPKARPVRSRELKDLLHRLLVERINQAVPERQSGEEGSAT